MSERELQRIEVLSKIVEGRMRTVAAANVLGLTPRQVQRLLKSFVLHGASALSHKARGRRSNHQITDGVRDFAVELVREHYLDFGPTLAAEKLAENHSLVVSPQAKGRVERANQTLQDRLVKELRLRGIDTIEAANAFAPAFIADFNARFGKEPRNPKNLHRPLADHENLDGAMCRKEFRTLSQALTLRYDKVLFILEGLRPALHRVRQGSARHARGDHGEQAPQRSAVLDQERAGCIPAGAACEDEQRAGRVSEARQEAGKEDGFHE